MAEMRTSGFAVGSNSAGAACSITVTSNPCCASPSASAADYTAADNGNFGVLECHGHFIIENP